MLKKELIGLLICTLLITVAVAPGINALTINRHNVDEVNPQASTLMKNLVSIHKSCNPVVTEDVSVNEMITPLCNSNNNDFFENIEVVCRGPYLFDVMVRGYVVELKLRNHGNVSYSCDMKMYVTNLFGKDIFDFDPVTDYEYLRDNFQINWRVYTFGDFREARHLFGFFNVNAEFTLHQGGEHQSKEWTFHGLIFGISAVIFNPEGEIVEWI